MNTHHPLLASAFGCLVCVVVATLGFYPFRRRTAVPVEARPYRGFGR